MQPRDRRADNASRPDKRQRAWQGFVSAARVFARVALYAVGMTAAFYLVAAALFLLAPSVGLAEEAGGGTSAAVSQAEQAGDGAGQQEQAAPVYDASLGGGSGILPTGLSEDDATFVSIARLESGDSTLNDTLVSFRGEVVGEPVNSSTDSYKWVLVQSSGSSANSIEVLMTNEQVAQIKNWGSYQVKGATVRVTGIYRVADDNNTGALDVTAYVVRVMDEGGASEQPGADRRLVVAGVAFALLGAALTLINVYQKRRSRA